MKSKIAGITRVFVPLFAMAWLTGCGEHRTVSSEDVEHRKGERGTLILHEIGEEDPFEGIVTDNYPDGNPRFEVSYKDGLRDGNFTFWRENEIPLLQGEYRNGKRHGHFIAYGRAGEMVYEKKYEDDKLNGPCRFYYPFSEDDVEGFFRKMEEEGLDPGELKANSKIRYSCKFVDDIPTGIYKAYYHRGDDTNSTEKLLREKGEFNENGGLAGEQDFYFPEVDKLCIKLPTGEILEEGYNANKKGLSHAIEAAYRAIEELPAYRNRGDKPAIVYALDERDNEIAPVWTTNIHKIAIRDLNGSFLSEGDFNATADDYDQAKQRAHFLCKKHRIPLTNETKTEVNLYTAGSNSEENGERADKPAVEIVGLDKHDKEIEILWTSDFGSYVIPLHERITRKRYRLVRAWLEGKSWGSRWYLPDGSNLSILDEHRREIIQIGKKQEKP